MNEIKRLREEAGLTQREMAERIGVDIRTYQRWEAKTVIKKRIIMLVMAALSLVACGAEPRQGPYLYGCGLKEPFDTAPAIGIDYDPKNPVIVDELPECDRDGKTVSKAGQLYVCSPDFLGAELRWAELQICGR